ncbi:hypothetical protein [Priestia abyssalis]|uniref:hypothetical protein n=1 Tax=Priestia abyssalis TaxID=1221450 RepID=UPI000995822C|nr:hypothetical protein [Priestia abyssalis]
MVVWEGNIKEYDQSGNYIGTYKALIKKEGDLLFKMTVYFDTIYTDSTRETNYNLKGNQLYSSSLQVLKQRFSTSIQSKSKSKAIWKKRFLDD